MTATRYETLAPPTDPDSRICRIEGVVVAHIYPCIGMIAHDLALREPTVKYFLSFR
jgi:hypothetical protein